jgi:hypothetical protein
MYCNWQIISNLHYASVQFLGDKPPISVPYCWHSCKCRWIYLLLLIQMSNYASNTIRRKYGSALWSIHAEPFRILLCSFVNMAT